MSEGGTRKRIMSEGGTRSRTCSESSDVGETTGLHSYFLCILLSYKIVSGPLKTSGGTSYDLDGKFSFTKVDT